MALPVSPVCDNRYPVAPPVVPPTEPPSGGGGGAARPKNSPLTRDLEAWWDMDSATTNTDATGNALTLSKFGAGVLTANTDAYRVGGASLRTANVGKNVVHISGAAPAVLRPSGDFTFFVWARPSDTVTRNVCGVWDETGDDRAWRIVHNSTGYRFEISGDGTSGDVTAVQSNTGGALTWAFICVTRKGNTISLYVNDDSAVTGSFSGAMNASAAEFQIGGVDDSADPDFIGSTQNSQFDAAAMWSRALKSRDINERATSLYANGAGYAYADIGGAYGYASLSAAESSGDNWKGGDAVRVPSGDVVVDWVMDNDLAVSGHSGLRHLDPWQDGTSISAVSVINSEAAGVDPDAFGYTDNGVGTAGVDYENVVESGRATFNELSASGLCQMIAPDLTAGQTETMFVFDSMTASTDTGSAFTVQVEVRRNTGSSTGERVLLTITNGTTLQTNWQVYNGSTYTDTSQDRTVQARFWIYLKNGAVAVWVDDDAAPVYNAAGQVNAPQRALLFQAGSGAVDRNTKLSFGYHLYASMTTA